MNAEAIVAAFTVVTGLATVLLVGATVMATRAVVRATLYERYVRRWESPNMLRRQARLATSLAQRDTISETLVPMERDMESVIGLFDELGFF